MQGNRKPWRWSTVASLVEDAGGPDDGRLLGMVSDGKWDHQPFTTTLLLMAAKQERRQCPRRPWWRVGPAQFRVLPAVRFSFLLLVFFAFFFRLQFSVSVFSLIYFFLFSWGFLFQVYFSSIFIFVPFIFFILSVLQFFVIYKFNIFLLYAESFCNIWWTFSNTNWKIFYYMWTYFNMMNIF